MPIYEYRCQACGIELEKLQKLSDPLLVVCPECGRETLVKLVSASSFRLKGGGWYETDFKTGKKKHGAGEADNAGDTAGKAGDKAAGNEATSTASKEGDGARSESKGNNSGDSNKGSDNSSDKKGDKNSDKKTSAEPSGKTADSTVKTKAPPGKGTGAV